jgi:transcription termination/antitermination protein NusA
MKSDFVLAFNEILEARALPKEVVIEAIEQALVSAYRRDANISSNQQEIVAEIDENGQPRIRVQKEIVTRLVDDNTEVLIEDALKHDPDAKIGEMIMMPVNTSGRRFGRIAAQTAKQVILQRIREAERETLYEEFIEREGDLMTATVQSSNNNTGVTLNLMGRAEAIMPRSHMMPGERLRNHDKTRVYIMEVNKSSRGPQIVVSRTHKDMLRRLLEYEVPEVYNGQVEIRNIAREAGYRSKVAVVATQEGIDPVGACVGMRGMRIQNIIRELNDEKIDVIEWDSDPRKFISKALSPARVSGVFLDEGVDQMRTATVVVPEDHLSLAIGREGQNARLAAKLTGWRIDIKSVTETAQEDATLLMEEPLSALLDEEPALVSEALRVIEKKEEGRPVMPEEYASLVEFVNVAENAKARFREEDRAQRLEMLEAVRPLVPDAAFDMSLDALELADDIVRALGRIDNVGELMIRVLSDEAYLDAILQANNAGDDALEAIKYALDDLVMPEIMRMEFEEAEAPAEELEAELAETPTDAAPSVDVEAVADDVEAIAETVEAEVVEEAETEPEALEETEIAAESVETTPDVDEEVPLAFPEVEVDEDADDDDDDEPRKKSKARKGRRVVEYTEEWEDDELDELDDESTSRQKRKRKSKKRQLIYDEDLGEVVARRRRKGSRKRNEFDEFELDEFE